MRRMNAAYRARRGAKETSSYTLMFVSFGLMPWTFCARLFFRTCASRFEKRCITASERRSSDLLPYWFTQMFFFRQSLPAGRGRVMVQNGIYARPNTKG